jgi:hypothetical protein
MTQDTDGPLFPPPDFDMYGMTLRDYFAAKAMVAEVVTSCSDATPEAAIDLADAANATGRTCEEQIAFNAYKLADAMLAERTKDGAS